MKRFLILAAALLLAAAGLYSLYYRTSFYLDLEPEAPVTTFTAVTEEEILVDRGKGLEVFEVRGVNLGLGKPGSFATEFAVTEEEYLSWFSRIQDMGANCIRVYTIQPPDFYEAFYQYNRENADPLYLFHGLWVNDYAQNSHMNAYDPDFLEPVLDNAKKLVDVIHGRRTLPYTQDAGSGHFRRDISPWVLGYILGVEWEPEMVAFTDHTETEQPRYAGEYFYAGEDASPFENVLAMLGDTVASYESGRYKQQRLIAFANWPTTDPLTYSESLMLRFQKMAQVDVEHIRTTEKFRAGHFASYHVYPYYPDYLAAEENLEQYRDENGEINTYRGYLKRLTDYHTIPVVISEFGVPSSRGITQTDDHRGFHQGAISEQQQGEALVTCYRDIRAAGCAGGIISSWQDEWFKRTWNTMQAVDLNDTAYWSDAQTNEQAFGLLAFDPGKEESICYVDGNRADWAGTSPMGQFGAFNLSMQYDEKYLYFLAEGPVDQGAVYFPLDITPKSGAAASLTPSLSFQRPADFLVVLDGAQNSTALVQKRYDCLRAMYGYDVLGVDPYEFPPLSDSNQFGPIRLILQTRSELDGEGGEARAWDTGKLTMGNGNPASDQYNSLADFCYGDGFVELRLPWQLLNFSNPSNMEIHDDYYACYGVEELRIQQLWAGVGNGSEPISMAAFPLEGWGDRVTYHERLKESYYAVQSLWKGEDFSDPRY